MAGNARPRPYKTRRMGKAPSPAPTTLPSFNMQRTERRKTERPFEFSPPFLGEAPMRNCTPKPRNRNQSQRRWDPCCPPLQISRRRVLPRRRADPPPLRRRSCGGAEGGSAADIHRLERLREERRGRWRWCCSTGTKVKRPVEGLVR